ncbi:unnamed protein product [Spirodela intermedia]|uniref:Uncharacterized protein n=1 Tax=Spirodela intermedia TaxID=51605 RepID=A0A7I8JHU2_SPIIN|nr:unnamed protein product [Spirodela intermedia]CAA6669123.1 unnamed protein product [Spirodela intermedia]
MESCAAIGDVFAGPTARGFEISKLLLSRPSSVLVISAVGMLSTRRRSITDDDDDGCEGCFGDWDGDDGSFGGGRARGTGLGEWGSSSASSDPAFDVVYGVICCMALYSCSGFAFKRICQFLANKEKMALLRLIPHFAP